MNTVAPKRCAVYCRVSTDERLDQSFNSNDAQKECGFAYVASQRAEGWIPVPDDYVDPGFSRGNLERPGMKRLMADIEAGKIDTVVVYKIHRLTRSLSDFSRLIEVFERHKVSFVAVTQQFNTTTSMGRLMLNVLLSFAQSSARSPVNASATRSRPARPTGCGWAACHPWATTSRTGAWCPMRRKPNSYGTSSGALSNSVPAPPCSTS
jgi:predicted site-specific integrase-resolvase